jgi:hypothetical protein
MGFHPELEAPEPRGADAFVATSNSKVPSGITGRLWSQLRRSRDLSSSNDPQWWVCWQQIVRGPWQNSNRGSVPA